MGSTPSCLPRSSGLAPLVPFVLLPGLALAGCGKPAGDPEPAMRTISCAVADASAFTDSCKVETAGQVLVVHHPDGGFRRLLKVDDDRGVIAADGVEPAHAQWVGMAGAAPGKQQTGRLEVTIGSDRYIFPAKVRADAGKP